MERYVTRRIISTKAVFIIYDRDEKKEKEMETTIFGKVNKDSLILKNGIEDAIPHGGVLLEIKSVEHIDKLYGVTTEKFIANAVEMKNARNPIDSDESQDETKESE